MGIVGVWFFLESLSSWCCNVTFFLPTEDDVDTVEDSTSTSHLFVLEKKEKKSKRRGLDEYIRKSKRDPSKNLRGSRSLGENMKKSGAQRDKSCGASYAGDGLNSSGHSKPIQSSISSQGMLNLIEQQKWSIPSKKPSTRNI